MSVQAADPHAIACPRCGRPVGGDQAWCLECGAAARTRLVPAPGWRAPLAIAAAVALLVLAGLTWGFVVLTSDDTAGEGSPTTAPAPATTPATTPAP